MSFRNRIFWAIVFAALIFGALLVSTRDRQPPGEPPVAELKEPDWPTAIPDFSTIADVAEKKQAFFQFLQPMVEYHNAQLLIQRGQIQRWQRLTVQGLQLSGAEQQAMRKLAQRYGVTVDEDAPADAIEMLLRRVDVVPVSMALAQAATESGWGTSRFAVAGNNLFGIWCYKPGCGIVPSRRVASASHEVARFDSPAHSVRAYFRNINTHPAYRSFRDRRQQLRSSGQPLSGMELVDGLGRYSERGDLYIEQIRTMIRINQLERLDIEPSEINPGASDPQYQG